MFHLFIEICEASSLLPRGLIASLGADSGSHGVGTWAIPIPYVRDGSPEEKCGIGWPCFRDVGLDSTSSRVMSHKECHMQAKPEVDNIFRTLSPWDGSNAVKHTLDHHGGRSPDMSKPRYPSAAPNIGATDVVETRKGNKSG